MTRTTTHGGPRALLATAALLLASSVLAAEHEHVSTPFHGAKVNGGTVTHTRHGGTGVLELSEDFRVPDAPAPHWQVVDSRGNTFLLQRLTIKDGVYHRSIQLPAYVHDVAKVQIWCAYAEALLGEAEFERAVR